MKGDLYIFGEYRGHGAAAWVKGGVLHDLLLDPPAGVAAPGTVFRAVAGRPMKGLGGMMLEGPEGTLFLRRSEDLAPGQSVLVQVLSHAEPGKAPPVTRKLTFKSRYAIATPGAPGLNISKAIRDEEERARLKEIAAGLHVPDGPGLILRSAAEGADADGIGADISEMLELALAVSADAKGPPERLLDPPDAAQMAWREWPAPESEDRSEHAITRHGIDEMIEAAMSPRSDLRGGGFITVESTRALVAVDVNTGGDTSPAAGLKTTLAALKELPRLLRIKGLGGMILIDPAPVAKKDRKQVERGLRPILKADPVETQFVGWSSLGLIELQRRRERLPLMEVLR